MIHPRFSSPSSLTHTLPPFFASSHSDWSERKGPRSNARLASASYITWKGFFTLALSLSLSLLCETQHLILSYATQTRAASQRCKRITRSTMILRLKSPLRNVSILYNCLSQHLHIPIPPYSYTIWIIKSILYKSILYYINIYIAVRKVQYKCVLLPEYSIACLCVLSSRLCVAAQSASRLLMGRWSPSPAVMWSSQGRWGDS